MQIHKRTSDLAKQPRFRWFPAYLETQKFAAQDLGYAEGSQIDQILGLHLNQALIGEMSSGKALNTAAREIEELFRKIDETIAVGGNQLLLHAAAPARINSHVVPAKAGAQCRSLMTTQGSRLRGNDAPRMDFLNRTFRHWSLLPAVLLFALLTLYPTINLARMSVSTIEFTQGAEAWTFTPLRNVALLRADALIPPLSNWRYIAGPPALARTGCGSRWRSSWRASRGARA